MSDPLAYLLLFAAGLVAGALNVVAGGGSFLTLPLLIFLGLPATTANGTNRVAILLQNVGAVWGFKRHRLLPGRRDLVAVVGPALVGAALGSWAALTVGEVAFRRFLATVMVAVTLWTLLAPRLGAAPPADDRGGGGKPGEPRPSDGVAGSRWLLALAFFGVGVYGGFVQAGVGFLILAVTSSLAGLDLKRGNALKVLAVLVFTPLSLAIFAWQGHVDWPRGLALAAGTLLGSQIGVHLTVIKDQEWLRWAVTAAVVAFAIRLWF